MQGLGFHTLTLGCKLNQFDTAAIEAELAGRGYVPQPDRDDASVVVVNTCTVTSKADAEARKLVRSIHRANPDAQILITGCYAEREPEQLQSLPGVKLVFGNAEKHRLPALLDDAGFNGSLTAEPANTSRGDRGCNDGLTLPGALHFGEKSRAFLKVQEGCDLRCSYCIIPQVRGASRSVPALIVRQSIERLLSEGYREIVLTGVNTGDWGKDFSPKQSLADLLSEIFKLKDAFRLRLNSLEPRTITNELIEWFTHEPRLAPHLQIPLQSGSDSVLSKMRRNYRTKLYNDLLQRLKERVPKMGLGADVIVGFPGEDDSAFDQTFEFIKRSALNYLHVFSWSPRPGVPAATYAHRPHGSVVKERSLRLRTLAEQKGKVFRQQFAGSVLGATVLGSDDETDFTTVLTENFFELQVARNKSLQKGDLVNVEVNRANPFLGTIQQL